MTEIGSGNGEQPKAEKEYTAQVVIEQFAANSAFREMTQHVQFRNLIQTIAGIVAGTADVTTGDQSMRISVVSDNGSVDFRYTLRKPTPKIIRAAPSVLANLDKEIK